MPSMVIDHASSGDNTLIAAPGANRRIRVTGLFLVVAGAVTVRFEAGAGGTALTGQMQFAAAGDGLALQYNPGGWFETDGNKILNLELSSGVSVDGALTYEVVRG